MTDAYALAFPLGEIDGHFPFAYNGRRIILSRDFAYVDPVTGLHVVIPADFESDFNSTPQFLWGWFPPQECPEAGVTHDYLYQHPGALSRADVDAVHRRIMVLKGERQSKAYAAWSGIRIGAQPAWNKYRRGEKPDGGII